MGLPLSWLPHRRGLGGNLPTKAARCVKLGKVCRSQGDSWSVCKQRSDISRGADFDGSVSRTELSRSWRFVFRDFESETHAAPTPDALRDGEYGHAAGKYEVEGEF